MIDMALPNGQRHRKHFDTKAEADEAHHKMKIRIHAGTWALKEPKMITFADLAPMYIVYCALNKSKSTVKSDECRINLHLKEYFGEMFLTEITVDMVEAYKGKRAGEIYERTGKKTSAKSINHDLSLLQSMMKFALERDYVRYNVVTRIRKMRLEKNPRRFLRTWEVDKLLRAAEGSHIHALLETAVATGMRKSELFNLEWTDIDFEQGDITVQNKADWHTKNRKSRTLALTPRLKRVLIMHGSEQKSKGFDCKYVFTYKGRKLQSSIKRSLKTVLRKAGLEGVTLHTCRHTFASQLCMAGVPLREVQELMGHASYETTLQYAHLSKDHVKKQVLRLPFADE
ncbi:tyrosine-type recombinase/integrase [Candidatus Poribacteria bacterium]